MKKTYSLLFALLVAVSPLSLRADNTQDENAAMNHFLEQMIELSYKAHDTNNDNCLSYEEYASDKSVPIVQRKLYKEYMRIEYLKISSHSPKCITKEEYMAYIKNTMKSKETQDPEFDSEDIFPFDNYLNFIEVIPDFKVTMADIETSAPKMINNTTKKLITSTFLQSDKNNDGILNNEEIKFFFKSLEIQLSKKLNNLEEIFETEMDNNNNDTDFLNAFESLMSEGIENISNVSMLASTIFSRNIYHKYDTDNNNCLTKEELLPQEEINYQPSINEYNNIPQQTLGCITEKEFVDYGLEQDEKTIKIVQNLITSTFNMINETVNNKINTLKQSKKTYDTTNNKKKQEPQPSSQDPFLSSLDRISNRLK